MNKLAKGSLVKGYTEETGEFVMKADTVERIEGALKEFEWTMPNVKIGKAMTVYKETITESSNQTCMARSQNKHNRLYATAKPLVISPAESNEDHAARARRLCK
jgi:elongation factor 2